MIGRTLLFVMRIFYVAIAGVGLSLVASGYPPSGSEPPVLLGVGVILTGAGIGGVIWPEKILSGSSTSG